MVKKTPAATKPPKKEATASDPFKFRSPAEQGAGNGARVHKHARGFICDTDGPGSATPKNRSLFEIVVHTTQGFIPLWEEGTILRWRFQERSFDAFEDPEAAKNAVKELLARAILAWGDSAPVKFTYDSELWDFEIVMKKGDECDISGCVLASAFFPDPGRHKLQLYPMMFSQPEEERLETLVHEIGHIFGLRHFFAKISEKDWPAEIFGTHSRFSIMNYGEDSKLTNEDRADLKNLYRAAWSGELKAINGTKIRLVRPFHTL